MAGEGRGGNQLVKQQSDVFLCSASACGGGVGEEAGEVLEAGWGPSRAYNGGGGRVGDTSL